jgi:hypothetical protein
MFYSILSSTSIGTHKHPFTHSTSTRGQVNKAFILLSLYLFAGRQAHNRHYSLYLSMWRKARVIQSFILSVYSQICTQRSFIRWRELNQTKGISVCVLKMFKPDHERRVSSSEGWLVKQGIGSGSTWYGTLLPRSILVHPVRHSLHLAICICTNIKIHLKEALRISYINTYGTY